MGSLSFKMFSIVNGKLGFYEEKILSLDEVRNVLVRFPCVLPFTSSRQCCVLRDVVLDSRVAEFVIVVRERGGFDVYVPFFDWYGMGGVVEDREEAFWGLEEQMELIDDEIIELEYKLRRSRSKQADKLRRSIRDAFGIKRVRINNVVAVVVVNRLSEAFKKVVDAVNEIIDTVVYAMEMKAYCKDSKSIYVVSGYE